jgi:hypothetical protein
MSENESWKRMAWGCRLDSKAFISGPVTTSCKTVAFVFCNKRIILDYQRYVLLSLLFIFYLMRSIIKIDWRQGTIYVCMYVWSLYYITSSCFRPLTHSKIIWSLRFPERCWLAVPFRTNLYIFSCRAKSLYFVHISSWCVACYSTGRQLVVSVNNKSSAVK